MGSELRLSSFRTRMRSSTPSERSAWLWRATFGTAIVVAEYYFLYHILDRRDSPVAFGVSWVMLFLLPSPIPRLVLLAARSLAVRDHYRQCSRQLLDAVADVIPELRPWTSCDLVSRHGGHVDMDAFFASDSTEADMPASQPSSCLASVCCRSRSQIGAMRTLEDQRKPSERSLSLHETVFGPGGHGIVRNGVLLYGPQGTGKNLLAEATAGEFRANFHPCALS